MVYTPGDDEDDEDQEESSSSSTPWLLEQMVDDAIDTAQDIAEGMLGLNDD